MSSPHRLPPSLQPFGVWNDLVVKTAEMLVASAQVIGHRTGRMALAGPLPSARDRQEFTLMGQEKVVAATQSAAAMGSQWMTLGMRAGLRFWCDLLAATQASMAFAASRTPQESADRQAALADSIRRSAESMNELGSIGAQVVRRGLGPIHAKATANAKRLARG